MDKLGDYIISDEEEPRPKARKTLNKIAHKQIPKKTIRKSNFSQVRTLKIYETKYRKWIQKNNTKINEFFKKVHKAKNFYFLNLHLF